MPTFPTSPLPSVAGHLGNVLVGDLGGRRVAMLQGRFHFYEGHDLETVTFPVRVLKALGVRTLILTAATGGINPSFRPGDLVCLSDHINLLGVNPLRGSERRPPRPPVPRHDRRLCPGAPRPRPSEARALGLTLHEGVYACLPGPSYETPAEIRMLRGLGADVVGMSTVPEAIVARHARAWTFLPSPSSPTPPQGSPAPRSPTLKSSPKAKTPANAWAP